MDPKTLEEIFTTRMPFGKYKDTPIAKLPAYYLEWFHTKGFPPGKLGMLMATVFEIKTNGLDEILTTLERQFKK